MAMLTLKYDEEKGFRIKTNDEGEWKLRTVGPVAVLIGYDGENTITVQETLMQDGSVSILVSHLMVDFPIEIRNENINSMFESAKVVAAVNQMIKELLNF